MFKFFHTNTMTNEWEIGGESSQSVNMWAEWACTMEDGVPCSSSEVGTWGIFEFFH